MEFFVGKRSLALFWIFLQLGSLIGAEQTSVFKGITDPKLNWCYKDATCGEATWPKLCSSGKAQSPIDLPEIAKTTCTIKGFARHSYASRHFSLESNKRTVGIKFLDFEPNFEWQEQHAVYTLHSIQLHWGSNDTTGSEHSINSKKFALEMQMIHYRDEFLSLEEAINSGSPNSLAIVAVLFEIDTKLQRNEDLYPVIKYLPGVFFPNAMNTIRGERFSPSEFIKGSEAYTYQGSLTSPSCNEQVMWLVFKQPNKISPSDLEVLRKVTNVKGEPLLDNFRSTQKLEDRKVQLCEVKYAKEKRRQISLDEVGGLVATLIGNEPAAVALAAVVEQKKEMDAGLLAMPEIDDYSVGAPSMDEQKSV